MGAKGGSQWSSLDGAAVAADTARPHTWGGSLVAHPMSPRLKGSGVLRMKVGIDARKIRDGGIGSHIRQLLDGYALTPRGHTFVAFVSPEDLGRVARPGGVVGEAVVRAGKYGLVEHVAVPRAARRHAVDLMHSPHYTLPLGWRGPAVVTIHDLIHVAHPSFFPAGAALYARTMASLAARRARLVLVNSRHTHDEVLRLLRVPERKLRLVHHAIEPGFERPAAASIDAFREARGLPPGYLLYVGARARHKNLALLLETLAAFREAERPVLVLSGAPWTSDHSLAREAARLGVADHVKFSGRLVDIAELSRLYAGAALYVHPAITEGFGLPPLEAMACGTAVLSSNGGSLPEVVGDAGVLLPPDDPGAWRDAIRELLGSAEKRATLVCAGTARVARFPTSRMIAGTLDAYEEAFSG